MQLVSVGHPLRELHMAPPLFSAELPLNVTLTSVGNGATAEIRLAFDFNEDGRYVVIPGLEWTKRWGHLNLYDPKTRHWPQDPAAFYKAAADAGIRL
jgi:hypothetical protein